MATFDTTEIDVDLGILTQGIGRFDIYNVSTSASPSGSDPNGGAVPTAVNAAGTNIGVVIKTTNIEADTGVDLFTVNLDTGVVTSSVLPANMTAMMTTRLQILKPLFDQTIPGDGGGAPFDVLQDQISKALFSMGCFGPSTLGTNDTPNVEAVIDTVARTSIMRLSNLSGTADYPQWFLFTIPHSVSPLFTLCSTAAASNVY